eukprot:TRINITY_DN4509_c2_g1_i1.p1 TRINITY_DN4509_c2_g1~~TRINITY_DN4509_c2_g1_i1.p1  ORF type:complete len:269 (+),score=47.78 TRINITY_DN4509_c2_g1_i1:393-1199(+)
MPVVWDAQCSARLYFCNGATLVRTPMLPVSQLPRAICGPFVRRRQELILQMESLGEFAFVHGPSAQLVVQSWSRWNGWIREKTNGIPSQAISIYYCSSVNDSKAHGGIMFTYYDTRSTASAYSTGNVMYHSVGRHHRHYTNYIRCTLHQPDTGSAHDNCKQQQQRQQQHKHGFCRNLTTATSPTTTTTTPIPATDYAHGSIVWSSVETNEQIAVTPMPAPPCFLLYTSPSNHGKTRVLTPQDYASKLARKAQREKEPQLSFLLDSLLV